ncbi:MAG TPA: BlaI/MecI/CopY family transcriptional regulator [Longimicrobiales bacterium]|nr:BlaI/MecI/CopY family transcriptional regulator [Longimicrobiales bacterium]
MSQPLQLTELQLRILQALWERGEAAVGDVHEELSRHRELTASSVATLLGRLEKRGLVARQPDGGRYLYRPLVSLDEVRAAMVGELTRLLFGGDSAALVAHLVASGGVRDPDRAYLRELFPPDRPLDLDAQGPETPGA